MLRESSQMSSNYPELVFTPDEDFTADRLNKAMEVLDQRLRSLEPFTPSWQAAVNDLRAVGLSRINDAILPAYNRVQQLASLGFLFAGSDTSLTLVEDQDAIFTIDNEVERELFVPTPFLAIVRESTTDDWAIGQFVSYDNDTGALRIKIKAITGNAGPHNDWQIGAVAGNTIAAMVYFSQIDAARNEATISKNTAVTNAALTAADRTQTGLDRAAAANSATSAAASATAAQTFDPTNFYTKTQANTAITNAVNALVNGAPGALDTLKELADAINDDAAFSATVTTALGNRLRVDAAQGLAAGQQVQGRENLGINQMKALAASQDFNTVKTSGIYYTPDSTPVNAPAAAYWYLFVEVHGTDAANYVKQTATRRSDGVTYIRIMASGAWQPWIKVTTDDTLGPYAKAASGQLPGNTGGVTGPGAGMIGELITISGGVPSLSSGVSATAQNGTLTPGVWDVSIDGDFNGPGATQANDWIVAFGKTAASTLSTQDIVAHERLIPVVAGNSGSNGDVSRVLTRAPMRLFVPANTTYYLCVQASFTNSSYSVTARAFCRRAG